MAQILPGSIIIHLAINDSVVLVDVYEKSGKIVLSIGEQKIALTPEAARLMACRLGFAIDRLFEHELV